jgi:SAM-dependent methyltransferase
MIDDVQAMANFYATRQGRLVTGLLRRRLQGIWPDLSRQTVLGLGHTAPFLPLWRGQARQCIDAVTGIGPAAAGTGCLVQDDALPFADSTVDRVLMVHAIENAAHVTRTLRAVWRVMRDDGRLLIVVSNRTGLWAHSESTPFADGAPCSTGRIERLLARSLFRIERMDGALYGPPSDLRPLLRAGPMLETASRFISPRLAGVLVVEAVKEMYGAVPVLASTAVPRRRRVLVRLGVATGQAFTSMPYSSSRSR